MLYASTLAGMVIANTGTTAVHSMGYSLTYFKDIDHGRANGLLLAAFLTFVEESCQGLIKTILTSMGLKDVSEFSKTLDDLLGSEQALTENEIEKYVMLALKTKNINNCTIILKEEDLRKTFKVSFNKKNNTFN